MITVGEGMRARMDAQGDHPVYGHEQGSNEDGSAYETCWGMKGLYISSNASGNWENVGPFFFSTSARGRIPPRPIDIRWVGSPNFWPGRPSGPPIAIVVHTMAGSLKGTDGWFNNPENQESSAHFGVGLNGEVHQYVKVTDRAWANGILEAGHRWFGPSGVNPNDVTVSIETEDLNNPNQAVTDEQWASVTSVAQTIAARYPNSIKYVTSHSVISPSSRAQCCGQRWIGTGRLAALADQLGLELRV